MTPLDLVPPPLRAVHVALSRWPVLSRPRAVAVAARALDGWHMPPADALAVLASLQAAHTVDLDGERVVFALPPTMPRDDDPPAVVEWCQRLTLALDAATAAGLWAPGAWSLAAFLRGMVAFGVTTASAEEMTG